MKKEALYVENLSTDQSAGQNLEYVSLWLYEGEILGVTGLGDSGTAALADALVGALSPSGGAVYLYGQRVHCPSEEKARELGIFGITYDEAIVSEMSVSENLNVLRGFAWRDLVIRKKRNREVTQAVFEQYGISGEADQRAGTMTAEQRLELSICRALLCGARILVCREVGEGFSAEELRSFTQFLQQIRNEGIPVIVFNSDVRKALQYADRVVVMRGGMACWTCETAKVTAEDIYRRMQVQRQLPPVTPPRLAPPVYVSLERVRPLKEDFGTLSLHLRPGQTFGVLCEGTDRMGLLYRLFSGTTPAAGAATENGRRVRFDRWLKRHARDTYCLNARFWQTGLYENLTAAENIVLRSMCRFGERLGVLNERMLQLALRDFAQEHALDPDALRLYPRHLPAELRSRIVLLSALFAPPKLLVLDHPFYTIDERIKGNLLQCIDELKTKDTAVLWGSNDYTVLSTYCDHMIKLRPEP